MSRGAARSFLRWREIPRGVWVLGFVSLLMDLSSETIHALLPLYMVTTLGASVATVGLVEGVAEATASIVKVFSGTLSDRIRRRKLLVAAGYGLAALTKPIFPLAGSVAWIGAARFLDRVGKGLRGAPRDALIADLAPAELRGASFGLRQSLDTVGAFLGPLAALALMLAFADDVVPVLWIAVVPAVLAFALVLFGVEEPPERTEHAAPLAPPERARLDRAYWSVVGVGAVFTLARSSEAFLLLRAQSVGLRLALVPGVLVLSNLAFGLAAWPAGVLSDRIGRLGLLGAGMALLVLADLALALGTNLVFIGAGVVLWGLHLGLTQGVFASLVADRAPPERRGTAFGVFHLATGLATLAASLVAGVLWDAAGPRSTFLAAATFSALALLALPLARATPGAP